MVSLFLSEGERECSNFERDRAHERFKFFKLILIFLPAREHRIGQHRQSIVPSRFESKLFNQTGMDKVRNLKGRIENSVSGVNVLHRTSTWII